jgi:hypothetical protein
VGTQTLHGVRHWRTAAVYSREARLCALAPQRDERPICAQCLRFDAASHALLQAARLARSASVEEQLELQLEVLAAPRMATDASHSRPRRRRACNGRRAGLTAPSAP